MNINIELKLHTLAMQDFVNWYNEDKSFNKPININDIFKHDFEITASLLQTWLYRKHKIIIIATEISYYVFHSKDAKNINIKSKYRFGDIVLAYGNTKETDYFENLKIGIVIAISMLTNRTTPF